ncbi:unknown [Clostridium sp. CAG:1013]|nr:unknown [Clostridium sp. CAG:1013]
MARAAFNVSHKSVLENEGQVEAFIHIGAGEVDNLAEDLLDLRLVHLHDTVDEVHAPVKHHATAIALLAAPAEGAIRAAAADAVLQAEGLASQLLVIDFLDQQIVGIPSSVLPGIEHLSGLLGNFQDLFQFGGSGSDRLLTKHVLASPHGLDGDLRMEMVGNRDQNDVHFRIVQDLFQGLVHMEALSPGPLLSLLVDIINAGKMQDLGDVRGNCFYFVINNLRKLPICVTGTVANGQSVAATHISTTNNSDIFHFDSSPFMFFTVLSGNRRRLPVW